MAMTPAQAQQWAIGYLNFIGAPASGANDPRVAFLAAQVAHEGTDAKNNPLAITSGEGQATTPLAGNSAGVVNFATVEDGYRALTAMLNGSQYLEALKSPTSTVEQLTTALSAAGWEGSGTSAARQASTAYAQAVGSAAGGTGVSPDQATLSASTFAAPLPGVNPQDFHGYDLSAIPENELGNAEREIEKYIVNPGYAQQIQNRVSQDFGYQGSWAEKIPQLNAVLIWASATLDPSTASGRNAFQSAVANTTWWKTTDANQRAWEQVQGTDPAQAAQALGDAQEKVLADANQMGVSLTKAELDSIANMYASQTFVQSGSLGSQSGIANEWLDQAITDTILNIKNQKAAGIPTDFSTLPTGQSDFLNQTQGGTSPTSLYGISSQLYNQFQQIAQQYLMYNPNSPGTSLLNQSALLNYVSQALQNYTGTGSSFGSSNLINGAVEQFTQEMQKQASQLYPSLAPSIAQGVTPQAYVTPYANLISQTLGINPNSINFTSPEWNWVIASPTPGTNLKQAVTLDQLQQKLVQMPQFDQSNNAMQMANDVTVSLNKQMGFGGS